MDPKKELAGPMDEGVSRPTVEVVVSAEEHGVRVDVVLAARKLASRSEIQRWAASGAILRSGQPLIAKSKVREGDVLAVTPAPPPPSTAEPEAIPLDIRYEDDALLVVHKPAGMVVHPAPGHPSGTLVNGLLHHTAFRDESGDPMRPGIVHRIDKETSGLLVVAKSRAAREGLVSLFSRHDIERRYAAISVGPIAERVTFDTLHARHPRDRKRFTTHAQHGKRAVTHVALARSLRGGANLVRCTLETGRTHQIRVHLAENRAPILADAVYGPRRRPAGRIQRAAEAIGRHALHAELLGFVHPVSGERFRFEAPVPDDFQRALAILELDAD